METVWGADDGLAGSPVTTKTSATILGVFRHRGAGKQAIPRVHRGKTRPYCLEGSGPAHLQHPGASPDAARSFLVAYRLSPLKKCWSAAKPPQGLVFSPDTKSATNLDSPALQGFCFHHKDSLCTPNWPNGQRCVQNYGQPVGTLSKFLVRTVMSCGQRRR